MDAEEDNSSLKSRPATHLSHTGHALVTGFACAATRAPT